MTSPRGPNPLLLAILVFAINLSLSPKSFTLVAATSPLVDEFCNRKDISHVKPFCHKIFESDPRTATAKDEQALFKIALDQGIAKVKEIEDSFSSMGSAKADIKPTLDLCADHFKSVANTFEIYSKSVVDTSQELDVMSLSYDFDLALIDANKCNGILKSAKIHDVALKEKSKEVADYFTICYGITKVVTNAP